jgi:hypothetical protein
MARRGGVCVGRGGGDGGGGPAGPETEQVSACLGQLSPPTPAAQAAWAAVCWQGKEPCGGGGRRVGGAWEGQRGGGGTGKRKVGRSKRQVERPHGPRARAAGAWHCVEVLCRVGACSEGGLSSPEAPEGPRKCAQEGPGSNRGSGAGRAGRGRKKQQALHWCSAACTVRQGPRGGPARSPLISGVCNSSVLPLPSESKSMASR